METQVDQIFCIMAKEAQDGYFIYDVKGKKFLFLNDAMYSIFSISNKTGFDTLENLLDIVHHDDRELVTSAAKELIEAIGNKKYVFRLQFDSEEKYIQGSFAHAIFEGKAQIFGILEDITVAQHNKIHIDQINARKNITLEVLSHDIKEPLGMIQMIASSLQDNLEQDKDKVKESLQFIRDMCDRNLKLIKSMVNREFLKSSDVELKKERVDLVWEIKDVVRFYRRSNLSNLRVFNFRTTDEKIYARVDTMKFIQVVNNLISNAIKYTPLGGEIEVCIEDRDTNVMVSVSDNGIGIPEKLREDLFIPSKESFRTGLEGQPSGGLGLVIIKKIVQLHGGKVYLVSEEGYGTTFFIDLPK